MRLGGGERRGGGVGRLIEGGGVGRPDRKNLQILDLHRLASLPLSTSPSNAQLKDEFSVIFVILLRLNQQERLRGKEQNPLSLLQSDSKMHVSVLNNRMAIVETYEI